ncbi:molybdate ABC transporter substrate-binding protein [Planktothrix sp. FACHB-1355]|uniref:Molybdate ABC transporter substrate-binding protein n=1 Tax=Aerosakkonema funiforme FACHB-1375 TaxID=2949571 RepID=A0A926ZGR5_9CYAN|nr:MULTISPECIES: molybdate ABC transporter substrate-binding protein [Oscillatoriales]MBD2181417.1 molybdate ABC transporter substrate-binding protein [Aerosakkonema funiforme FACHB-1375]MBD3560799.1 molybdate ABC transporter substrate-binding protein [Planktothrix sp. FACHB-1355]
MKKQRALVLIISIAIINLVFLSCNLQQAKPVALLISAATSYQEVLTEIGKIYKQENPHVTLSYNFGPSLFIKEQILKRIPIDLIIFASKVGKNDPELLNLLIPETLQTMPIKNPLVLIADGDSTIPIFNFQDLVNEKVKKIAMGNEKLLVGMQAKETLISLGIYDRLKNKAIFTGEDIRQILKAVETNEADAGITYLTEAKVSDKVKIVAIAPENTHFQIIYNAAVVKRCQNVPEAQKFIQFLSSETGKEIAKKYGFTLINK